MGTLYLVGTPIGNLEDITLRALRILREVDLIAAEDTRRTRKLLDHYNIQTPMVSYFEHTSPARQEAILEALNTRDVALVSEAGMPGLSDPGYRLVREAIARGFPVKAVPGPSAPIAALVLSGLPADSFIYLGFLPRRQSERQKLLASLAYEQRTLVAFEAPHRLLETLADMLQILGNRKISLARELTKIHEEVWRGSLDEALTRFQKEEPRGEFTLVVEGEKTGKSAHWNRQQVREMVKSLLAEGLERKKAVKLVAQLTGKPRREVYEASLEWDTDEH
ncbi:MAG: 16S rRNA (cytidine(1402)-2'-O)-methyltransferase [Anaerolineae bacterium]